MLVAPWRWIFGFFALRPNRRTYQPAHHARRTLAYVRSPLGPFQKQQALRSVHAHSRPRPAPGGANRKNVQGRGTKAVHFRL